MANKKVSQLTSKPSVLTTDLFPIADPSTGQLFKTTISDLGTAIGSGVSSVNGLVGAVVLDTDDIQELVSPTNKWFTDTRARAALSASSPLTYNSGTGVFGIQVANGSQNGYLSSADWTTFNAKQAALSGTGFVKISGTTISYDNSTYLTTGSAASTYLALAGGTLTGSLNGTSATFTGDLTISSTNPRIYLTDTDNNPDYFISNTDGTFTVYDVTNSLSRFTIGTTGNAYFRNAITGGGSITGESLYSNGIISAGTSLSVGTFVSAGGSLTGSALYVTGMTSGSGAIYHTGSRLTFANYNASGTLHFEVNGGTGALTINADLSATFQAGASFASSITGTNATFSGIVKSSSGTRNINMVSYSADYNYLRSNGASLVFGTQDSQDLYIKTNDTTRLTLIGSTGAATFSSTISTTGVFINYTSSFGGEKLNALLSSNLGISTVPAVARFMNNGSGYVTKILLSDNNVADATISFVPSANSTLSFGVQGATSNFQTLNIKESGNVGIGTTSPTNSLTVSSTINYIAQFYRNDNQDSRINITNTTTTSGGDKGLMLGEIGVDSYFYNYANGNAIFGTNATERMRIKSNGIINFSNVPTSSAGLSSGDVYKTVAGVLMIV